MLAQPNPNFSKNRREVPQEVSAIVAEHTLGRETRVATEPGTG